MPYDKSLFAGTAYYYTRYRVPYPAELIADLAAHYELDGTGRLLDLGCGPGTLTLPLAPHFSQVLAVDLQAEMIDEAHESSTPNVEWHVMRAEKCPLTLAASTSFLAARLSTGWNEISYCEGYRATSWAPAAV